MAYKKSHRCLHFSKLVSQTQNNVLYMLVTEFGSSGNPDLMKLRMLVIEMV